ncbi:MAG: nucleotide pyrophosphohydrolase [Myxococcota bacterium]
MPATLPELTELVREFVTERDWERYHSPRNLAMALSVESAELLELYLWSADDGPQPLNPDRNPRVADEAADVFMCLLNLCDKAGIDLEDALRSKLVRAREKYPADKVRGKALKYDEY